MLTLNISNYWMRLSRIWRILQIEDGVIHYPPPLHTLRDLQNCAGVWWSLAERETRSGLAYQEPCTYSRTSLIRTLKGQNKVSVLERCPYERGHYDSFKCSVAKSRLTLVLTLHLNLIHSTKTLSFSSILHCTSQLQSEYSRRQITALKRNELQRSAVSKRF